MLKIKLLAVSIGLILSAPGYAIYIGDNNQGKSLPGSSVIPPVVSILDAVDFSGQPIPESYPTRKFDYFVSAYNLHIKYPFEHDCAATLVGVSASKNQSYLLTSAHCVTDEEQNGFTIDSVGDKRIVVGNSWCDIDSSDSQACKYVSDTAATEVYKVSGILVNSNWVKQDQQNSNYANDYDFAILVVNGVLKLNGKNITPMTIADNTNDWREDKELYVAGWGTTVAGQQLLHAKNSDYKMPMVYEKPNYTDVNTLPTVICQKMIDNLQSILGSNKYNINSVTTICSGQEEVHLPLDVSTACYGDSGGPLFATQSLPENWSAKAKFILVGNVSWSPLLCQPTTCDNPNKTSGATQDCNNIDPTKAKQPQPVPFIYGFPGGVLCKPGSLSSKSWILNSEQKDLPAAGLESTSLQKALPNFQPNCQ